jgi:hypothetical protein
LSLYQEAERGTSWFRMLVFGLVHQFTHSSRWAILALIVFSSQDFWPLRLAAVEAGKWGCGCPGRRSHCDACQLVTQDGAGDHRQELSIVA